MPTPATLDHLTLNTGHRHPVPRDAISAATIALLTPYLARGGGVLPPPFADYTLLIPDPATGPPDTAAFTVLAGTGPAAVPLVTGFCCWRAASSARFWAILGTGLAEIVATFPPGLVPPTLPARPRAVPWLAVLLWPTVGLDPDALGWLGDLERCLAWTLIEQITTTTAHH